MWRPQKFDTYWNVPGSAALSINAFGPAPIGQGFRSSLSGQTKKSVLSNALSSPVRRRLQHYHQSNNGNYTRDPKPHSSKNSSMDIYILIALAMILLVEAQSVFCS